MAGFRQAVRELLRSLSAHESSLQRSVTAWRIACREAEERGGQLLIRNLSAVQREQYETRGYFEVVGGDTGKHYRIRRGHQLNVEELDEKGRRLRLLCFMPEGSVPVGDIMLAQKLSLELFESDALRVANRSPAWGDLTNDVLMTRSYRRR
jgi:hypothetical protein